ncbi:SURF1 family protein [Rhizobium herbae]|uniref:SURF1-like protein n=1 Tax=Rhizobium herbae TaxID=508661 RepID=A0ABS4EQF1_9HYPH|nr:SURF1 family protein [Rhizobium herbae]MBP1860031.1 surfeit locus 1 family protein [Rhizobium herbae]
MSEQHALKTQHRRSPFILAVFGGLLLLVIMGFAALGIWQLERLSWKLDLIARVDARVHAAPVPPPERSEWQNINAAADEYRRITVSGTFLNDSETLVGASTELGPGFWVMTPLVLADGTTVFVNRGFVPSDRRDRKTRPDSETNGIVTVTGLMRMTEPKGSLLQSNDPAAGRWYSRDVAAIAQSLGMKDEAPYFIDAEAAPVPGQLPVGGLTKIVFPNNHLVYAITWFALALMTVAGCAIAIRHEWAARDRR